MSNLLARIITALIGVAILLSAVLYDQWTYLVVFLVITLLSLLEFLRLGKKSGKKPFMTWGLLNAAILFSLTFLFSSGSFDILYLLIYLAWSSSILGLAIFRRDKDEAISSVAFSTLGIVYIAVPMSLLNVIALYNGTYRPELIIGLLFCLWANDVGGYLIGKSLGKTKLYESVSPKKTIEGSVGGILLALLIGFALSLIFDQLSLIEWLGLAAVISVFGSIGDLAESLFKRNLAIKDSGSSLPGHGGFLDRFDGLFLALPFATLYIHLII